MIFVFGSNLSGRHGKGAALTALRFFGAIYGKAEGLQGRSYALPTCDHRFQPLPLAAIEIHVADFLGYARKHKTMKFKMTRIGCGLGRYHDKDIAPMFQNAPNNVFFDDLWRDYLGETHEYWGTY